MFHTHSLTVVPPHSPPSPFLYLERRQGRKMASSSRFPHSQRATVPRSLSFTLGVTPACLPSAWRSIMSTVGSSTLVGRAVNMARGGAAHCGTPARSSTRCTMARWRRHNSSGSPCLICRSPRPSTVSRVRCWTRGWRGRTWTRLSARCKSSVPCSGRRLRCMRTT